VLPLVYRGERLGEMRVSTRTPGEPYGRVDRALLDQLANETSALVYALRRDTELQSTRRQALETVAEERARLGRDLHDGIAPLLAGAGLTAEALRKGMTRAQLTSRTPSGWLRACGMPPPRSGASPMTFNPLRWTTGGSRQR
jgi:signal transduction histidine kinase